MIVTHKTTEEVENMDVVTLECSQPMQQLNTQVITKPTRLDKNKETKREKKAKKDYHQKKLQEKQVEFPEAKDQWKIMNTELVNVNMEEIKKVNRKGRKFSAKVAIPGDLIISNGYITKESNKSEHPPHFGLDSELADKYAGGRDKESGREYQLIDEPDPPNVQDKGGSVCPVIMNHNDNVTSFSNVDHDQVMLPIPTLPEEGDLSRTDDEQSIRTGELACKTTKSTPYST